MKAEIVWQRTGKVSRISKSFIYVTYEGETEFDEDTKDARDYPMHCTSTRDFRIGDSVLIRESVERLAEVSDVETGTKDVPK